jgi:D-amino-acid dehydrogenase
MKIVVLGAGVVGACTAWYLARSGHRVVLVDRQSQPASEASWGNAGLIAPSQAYSMASPRIWKMARDSFMTNSGPLKFKMPPDPALLSWMLRFLPYCSEARSRELTQKKLKLTNYSISKFEEIISVTGIGFDKHTSGATNILPSEAALDAAWHASGVLRDQGLEIERLDRDAVIDLEPCLKNMGDQLHGGLRSNIDWIGNPALFTRRLIDWLVENHQVETIFDAQISSLSAQAGVVKEVIVNRDAIRADAYVLALGAYSTPLARSIDLKIPIYPVKGYSVTAPFTTERHGLNGAILDSSKRLALTKIGEAVRVTFKAEFVGFDTSINQSVFELPISYLRRLFPNSIDHTQATYWSGFRPMSPSGLPIVGRTKYENLFLNTGHGHLGWTMAPGTGNMISDVINGIEPDVPLRELTEPTKSLLHQ